MDPRPTIWETGRALKSVTQSVDDQPATTEWIEFIFLLSLDTMDLHKIIHDALHEFIQTFIPDADLRWDLL